MANSSNEIARWTRWERSFLALVILLSLGLYGVIAYLPYAAIVQQRFTVDKGDPAASKEEVKRIESILSQLGTMGDMFGAVNALFTGLALTGLVYTGILQRKEIKAQQIELNRAEQDRNELKELQRLAAQNAEHERKEKRLSDADDRLILAYNMMVQSYSSQYASNRDHHDEVFATAVAESKTRNDNPSYSSDTPKPSDTVKGKMLLYNAELEKFLQMRRIEYDGLVRSRLDEIFRNSDESKISRGELDP